MSSDEDYNPRPSTKRKSDASVKALADGDGSAPAKKRARASKNASSTDSDVQSVIAQILAKPKTFDIPEEDEDVRALLVSIATYVKGLEDGNASSAPAKKTKEQLEAAAEKLRKAARSQITKQMTWKPSCKTGGAKWSYDGVAADPDVFATLLNLPEPPKWKQKKIPLNELQEALDSSLTASARFSSLSITSDINVKWNKETGEFKFSGSYGV